MRRTGNDLKSEEDGKSILNQNEDNSKGKKRIFQFL